MAIGEVRDGDHQEPEIRIKDRRLVEVAYPSGRLVRYLYNSIISEVQLPLILPPREPED